MLIIHVMGGLGNQLYQYAMYKKMKSLGKEVRLDFFDYKEDAGESKEWRKLELTRFQDMDIVECSKKERTLLLDNSMKPIHRVKRKIFGRKKKEYKESCYYDAKLFEIEDAYLDGFWECDKYYEDFKIDLSFPESDNVKNAETISKMREENSVSIHIRRTDYLQVADGKRYMNICTDAYYEAAMKYLEARVDNPVFYIFSDDIEYVKEKYKDKNVHIVDWNQGDDSLFDMQLMSNCKYNICANSTFSFWGAKLNPFEEKIMIRPLHHDNYEKETPEELKYLWTKWTLIDADGKVY